MFRLCLKKLPEFIMIAKLRPNGGAGRLLSEDIGKHGGSGTPIGSQEQDLPNG